MEIKELVERTGEIQLEYDKVVEQIQKTQRTLQDLTQKKSWLEGAYYEIDSLVKRMQSEVSLDSSSTMSKD